MTDDDVAGGQVGQASAQVPINITAFSVTPVTAYGSPLTYSVNLAVPAGQPLPTSGSISFLNSSITGGAGLPPPLIVFNLNAGSAVISGNTLVCLLTPESHFIPSGS